MLASLSDGVIPVTAFITDAAGNASATSAVSNITLDRTAPVAPSIVSVPENASGINAAEDDDGTAIQVAVPSDAKVGDVLTLNIGGQVVNYTVTASDIGGTATVPVSALTLTALTDGTIPVTATLTDLAGNNSATSTPFNFNLDRSAPAKPTIVAVPENADGGINAIEGSDGTVVNVSLPAGTQAGDTITLTIAGLDVH